MNRIFVYAGPNGKLVYLNFNEEKRIVRIGNQQTQFKLIPVELIVHSEIEATKDRSIRAKKTLDLLKLQEIIRNRDITEVHSYLKNEMNSLGLVYRGEITAEEDIKTFQMI
jgi:hypothetical protein